MKELVEKIVRALVDAPEEVGVQEIEGTNTKILEIKVSQQDVGKLIGRKGRNINAIRTVVAAAGKGRGYMVEVLGENRRRRGMGPTGYALDRDTPLTSDEEGRIHDASTDWEDWKSKSEKGE